MSIILGISVYSENNSAVLIKNGEIIAGCEENRIPESLYNYNPGIKKSNHFPFQSIKLLLASKSLKPADIDVVAYSSPPTTSIPNFLCSNVCTDKFQNKSFASEGKELVTNILFNKFGWIENYLTKIDKNFSNTPKIKISCNNALLSSAFYPCAFDDAMVVSLGTGANSLACTATGRGSKLNFLPTTKNTSSISTLMLAFSNFMGCGPNGLYELQALSAFGEPVYFNEILSLLVQRTENGDFYLNKSFVEGYNEKTTFGQSLLRELGITAEEIVEDIRIKTNSSIERLVENKTNSFYQDQPSSNENNSFANENDLWITEVNELLKNDQMISHEIVESLPSQIEADLASSLIKLAQHLTLSKLKYTSQHYNHKNLCLIGDICSVERAINPLLCEGYYENCWVQPQVTSTALAYGAALSAYHTHKKQPRVLFSADRIGNGFVGAKYNSTSIKNILDKSSIIYRTFDEASINDIAANSLASNRIVSWFRGDCDFGMHNTFSRAIFANPLDSNSADILNRGIKLRNSIQKFCLITNVEPCTTKTCSKRGSNPLPRNQFLSLAIPKKFSAVCGTDGNAAVMIIDKSQYPDIWNLIEAFKDITGIPGIAYSSLNYESSTIVQSPSQACDIFTTTVIDEMIIGNFVASKMHSNEQSVLASNYRLNIA